MGEDYVRRNKMFIFGCIGTRLTLAMIAWKIPKFLPLLAIFAAGVSIGMALIFLTNSRKTGVEVEGHKIWWNSLRPVHSALWAIFAVKAWQSDPSAWKFLFADTILGLLAFVAQRSGLAFTEEANKTYN